MINPILNYPSSSPSDSIYLPLNRRREYLSIVEIAMDPFFEQAQEFKKNYQEDSFFIKTHAINVIKSVTHAIQEQIKNSLSIEEQIKVKSHLEKIEATVISNLEDKPLAKKTYDTVKTIAIALVSQVELENPLTKLQPVFSLSAKDFEIADHSYHQKDYLKAEREPYCHDFAFYHLNEVNAFPFIFNSKNYTWPKELILQPIDYLAQWGYELTTYPKPGDLVVYCSTLNGSLQAKHWGIWTSNEKVLSKKGMSGVLEHPLEEAIIAYGNFVYFFHKKIKSPLLEDFLKKIADFSLSFSDSSHSLFFSPLSAKGCTIKVLETFEKMPVQNIFDRSIFNKQYAAKIRSKIFFEVWHSSANWPRQETLQNIKNIIFTVSEKEIVEVL